ncbi:MAG: HAMP domain-containing histidine kinase [Clostridia bacterium]|nr:HAMP domain-containing histidine kinase [Clostridia bacterium]
MATKSKNIKYGRGTKAAAALIAVIMFFSSGYFANLFIRGFADYNAYDKGRNHYTQTTVFREMFNYIEECLISDYEAEGFKFDSYEEYRESAYGKAAAAEFDDMVKGVSDAYDLLENSGIEVYVTADNSYRYLYPYKNFVYLFDYSGELRHEDIFFYSDIQRVYPADAPAKETTTALDIPVETTMTAVEMPEDGVAYTMAIMPVTSPARANSINSNVWIGDDGNGRYQRNGGYELRFYDPNNGQPPLEVQDIGQALKAISSISGYTCYGESTKARFLEEVEANREQYICDMYNNTAHTHSYEYFLENIKSVNYAIIGNGTIKTNCGVTANDTEEQIIQKLGGEFIEAGINGKYKVLKSNEYKSIPSVYDKLYQMLLGNTDSILNQSGLYIANSKATSAYFSYSFNADGTDPFDLSYRAYASYMNAPINDLTLCLILFAVSFLIACAACIYLLCTAGKTADGIKISFFDKIPAEINWAIGAVAAIFAAIGAAYVVVWEAQPENIAYTDMLDYGFTTAFLQLASNLTDYLIGLFAVVVFMILTGLFASLIRNIRNKSFWKHTLCYQLLRLAGWLLKKLWVLLTILLKPFNKIFKKISSFFKKQIDKIKYMLACDYSKGQGKKFRTIAYICSAGFIVATVIYYTLAGLFIEFEEFLAFLMYFFGILGDLAILGFVILIIVSLDRIMACVSQAREGKLDGSIDTKFMPPFMRRFAEDILSMQDGLQNAVESAVKDQRMKAELITNVSHDLKTPLTSIVNYVDLLKKCNVEDETAQRYINVLDEKAARMKKLIEDLVEASKASSGAIEIHPVKVNLCEFAAQAVGEHEDELNPFNIGLVLKAPPSPVTVTADSQKTSRIVENLFSNIKKYAMEGTRVYVEVIDGSAYGSIVFKNISKYPLDISADELTQRFVRGDASRSGEGSGLGLSIAQNLCELQKGKFKVEVDGDLFKVTLSLPKTE